MYSKVVVVFNHDDDTDAESLADGLKSLLTTALNTVFSGVFEDYGNATIETIYGVEDDDLTPPTQR